MLKTQQNTGFSGEKLLYSISSEKEGRFVRLDLLGKKSIQLSRHEAKQLARYIQAPASQHLKSLSRSDSSRNVVGLAVNSKDGSSSSIHPRSKACRPSPET